MKQLAVLTIAGSDPSGGAGIQADLKTFTALGLYGASVITALTAQNTKGVQGVFPTSPEFVEKQISSVLDDIEVTAIKTGMLFDKENTEAVIRALQSHYKNSPIPFLVCDPVCVSTSGHPLLSEDAVEVMIKGLFPLASMITPNLPEAELLLTYLPNPKNYKINSVESMLSAARDLLLLGSKAVLLKGGHLTAVLDDVTRLCALYPDIQLVNDFGYEENMEILREHGVKPTGKVVADFLCEKDGGITVFCRPRIESMNTHGTGCTLSSAIASELALGSNLKDASRKAGIYTYIGIETGPEIGHGHGPINHLNSIAVRSIPQRTKSNPYPMTRLLIQGTAQIWKNYVEHRFVKLLGEGTLPREAFICFIKQDYHYLKYYARAYGLLAAKANSVSGIDSAAQTILSIISEISSHKSLCSEFGIPAEELETTAEKNQTTAYGAYLLDVGLRGDSAQLLMAILACLLGYGEVGLWLKKQVLEPGSSIRLDGNPYRHWIEVYSGPKYQSAVKIGLETIEEVASNDPPSLYRYQEWFEIWRRCTLFEGGFWDMAMDSA